MKRILVSLVIVSAIFSLGFWMGKRSQPNAANSVAVKPSIEALQALLAEMKLEQEIEEAKAAISPKTDNFILRIETERKKSRPSPSLQSLLKYGRWML